MIGRIMWARSLRQRLIYLMDEATDHPVLKVMAEMADVQKKFGTMSVALLNYEEEIKNIWMNHNVVTIYILLNIAFVIIFDIFVDPSDRTLFGTTDIKI